MHNLPFKQVDVFTAVPFKGNPLAVVLKADGLTGEQMQQIANWTNLSETAFVLPASSSAADYRVRIFTPASELPFAGHPTIGTAHALLEAGFIEARDGALVQECAKGLIPLRVEFDAAGGRWISFELPTPELTALTEAETGDLEANLGCTVSREAPPQLVDVGARWIVAQLADAQAVLACRPDFARLKIQDTKARATGVIIFGAHAPGTAATVEVRAFAPASEIDEDPVCGSGNGCMAAFIRATGQTARFGQRFVASQGMVVGRAGLIRIAIDTDRIEVGGMSVSCIDGNLRSPQGLE
ncbi:PhzF family phenazine biosynthesis protein [Massilia sp. TWR1-2-2]|uniref:PhzF family phenazine biosynthesis protein n=1 Tax=Massilia sp. TWR1-2-2 TaxID=2804584 RepID=UPI003CF4AFEC